MFISALYQYPIKSCAGLSLATMDFDALGPVGDRRFMLIDSKGKFVSQRTVANMALIEAHFDGQQLKLSCPSQADLILNPAQHQHFRPATVWGDEVNVLDMGDEAATYLTAFLHTSVRLVYFANASQRLVDTDYASAQQQVAFADGFPLLVCNLASIEAIYPEQDSAEFIRRFRPNIVIAGAQAFVEDHWAQLKIGDQILDLVKPCSRCVMPAINPQTAARELDVIRRLAKQRRREDGQSYFGQNALMQNQKRIALNDAVEVLS